MNKKKLVSVDEMQTDLSAKVLHIQAFHGQRMAADILELRAWSWPISVKELPVDIFSTFKISHSCNKKIFIIHLIGFPFLAVASAVSRMNPCSVHFNDACLNQYAFREKYFDINSNGDHSAREVYMVKMYVFFVYVYKKAQ